jgi:hypothetical protein
MITILFYCYIILIMESFDWPALANDRLVVAWLMVIGDAL